RGCVGASERLQAAESDPARIASRRGLARRRGGRGREVSFHKDKCLTQLAKTPVAAKSRTCRQAQEWTRTNFAPTSIAPGAIAAKRWTAKQSFRESPPRAPLSNRAVSEIPMTDAVGANLVFAVFLR